MRPLSLKFEIENYLTDIIEPYTIAAIKNNLSMITNTKVSVLNQAAYNEALNYLYNYELKPDYYINAVRKVIVNPGSIFVIWIKLSAHFFARRQFQMPHTFRNSTCLLAVERFIIRNYSSKMPKCLLHCSVGKCVCKSSEDRQKI